MAISIDDQIKSVAREIAMRKNVYPKWVASGRLKQQAADHEIAAMEAVIETLKEVKKRSDDEKSRASDLLERQDSVRRRETRD